MGAKLWIACIFLDGDVCEPCRSEGSELGLAVPVALEVAAKNAYRHHKSKEGRQKKPNNHLIKTGIQEIQQDLYRLHVLAVVWWHRCIGIARSCWMRLDLWCQTQVALRWEGGQQVDDVAKSGVSNFVKNARFFSLIRARAGNTHRYRHGGHIGMKIGRGGESQSYLIPMPYPLSNTYPSATYTCPGRSTTSHCPGRFFLPLNLHLGTEVAIRSLWTSRRSWEDGATPSPALEVLPSYYLCNSSFLASSTFVNRSPSRNISVRRSSLLTSFCKKKVTKRYSIAHCKDEFAIQRSWRSESSNSTYFIHLRHLIRQYQIENDFQRLANQIDLLIRPCDPSCLWRFATIAVLTARSAMSFPNQSVQNIRQSDQIIQRWIAAFRSDVRT